MASFPTRKTPLSQRLFLLGQGRSGRLNRRDNILIPRAATQIAADPLADVVFAGIRFFLQKRFCRKQNAGRAKAALQTVQLPKLFLQRVQFGFARRQSFDRFQLCAVRLHGKHETRADRFAIQQHRAGAANAVLATDVRPRQAQIVPDEVGQELPWFDFAPVLSLVDSNRDLVLHGFGISALDSISAFNRPPGRRLSPTRGARAPC
jgi:hypothetical protein